MKGSTNSTGVKTSGLVDTTSNQTVEGTKTFTKALTLKTPYAVGTLDYPISLSTNDVNGNLLYCLRCESAANGKATPYITARNANGTTRDFGLEPYKYATTVSLSSISGITLAPSNGVDEAKKIVRYGDVIFVSLSIEVSGTFTGTTGWVELYTIPSTISLNQGIYTPWMLEINGHYLHQGRFLWMDNNQAYNFVLRANLTFMVA